MDISIIIPVYNTPRELFDNCINSLLTQKGDYEFLFINDGSTDIWIEERIKMAVRVDPRFRFINKPHSGLCDTRNLGLKEAKGTYVAFVDADDMVVEGAFEYMLTQTVQAHSDISLFGISNSRNETTVKKILSKEEIDDMIWACLSYRTFKYTQKGLIVDSTWAKLYKKNIIDKYNLLFPKNICKSEDAIFDVWFYKFAGVVYIDNTVVYDYVYNPNSISHAYKYEYVEMIPSYLAAKENFINVFYSNNKRFREAIAVRTIVALMDADHCYFSFSQKRKTFSQQVGEFKQLLSEPVVKRNLKNMGYSMLSKNQLPGFLNKMKLFFYKNNMVEIDMMLYRIFHLLKK